MASCLLFTTILSLIFMITSVRYSSPSLLSRFRNRQEYVPNADLEAIKSLDDETYEDLMNEIPILRQVFRGNGRRDSHRSNTSALPHQYESGDDGRGRRPAGAAPASTGSVARGSRRPAAPAPARPPQTMHSQPARRTSSAASAGAAGATGDARRTPDGDGTGAEQWHLRYPHVTSCYWCGLNESLLPAGALCHDAFTSAGSSARRLLRAQCYYRRALPSVQLRAAPEYPPQESARAQRRDAGLKLRVFGPFMRGCFKRFVDVGPLYTARGCRGAYLPQRAYTRSFASHRLMRLEVVARGHDDVCVHSPYASLTPFSRALSLYVRYHVCVCSEPYCNAAPGALLAAAVALTTSTGTAAVHFL